MPVDLLDLGDTPVLVFVVADGGEEGRHLVDAPFDSEIEGCRRQGPID